MPALPATLPFPFYTSSSSVSALVPGLLPAALNGRALMIDDAKDSGWSHRGIEMLRQQADQSTQPTERSLNPAGLWRRSQESWHRGAGQTYRDTDDADPFRFRSSKGVDPWTSQQLTLLVDTAAKRSGASTNYRMTVCGTRLYLADGTALYYTTDITAGTPSWTQVTGYTGGSILSLCSDGYTVYITDGANVWWTSLAGTTAATNANTLDCTVLGFVKGRLMAAAPGVLYNITVIGTPPAANLTLLLNTTFTWVGFAEGTNYIYAAGYTGDKSRIFKTSVKADGTALDAASQAGELPDGEIISSIQGYLGFILIGTDSGVRFAEADTNGNLTIGPLIDLGVTVQCFEGQENFVWFGWSNYDSTSTGLGRLDLRQFTVSVDTGGRSPAYVSDLMATAQGAVLSVVTFNDQRVFTVSGSGVWGQSANKVASGTIDGGLIGYGLPDEKTAVGLDVRTTALAGSYTAYLSIDAATFESIGTNAASEDLGVEFPVEDGAGRRFEVRLVLTGSTTTGPTITRWTLKAAQGANDGPAEYFFIPFLLHSQIVTPSGPVVYFDVGFERDAIKSLRQSRRVVIYQESDQSYEVQVENFEWRPSGFNFDTETGAFKTPNGVMVTQLKRIS